jgi:hypothetical protein
MPEHDEELARMRAQMDQGKEGLKELAGSLWAFYDALVSEGFQPDQALAVVITTLTANISNGGGE